MVVMNRATVAALAVWLALAGGLAGGAEPSRRKPAERPQEGPRPLPRYKTDAEKKLPPLPLPAGPRAAPTGLVYCPAEYEPNDGLLFSWVSYYDTALKGLIVGMTNNDPDATAWIIVDNASEQSSATAALTAAGADMSQVAFIIRQTDSVWIRDYGPRFIFEDGQRTIIDHTYNRPRPWDNLIPDYISSLWGEPQYDIPLTHGGGNFHLFSNGEAFMSDLILTENPGLSEQDVKDYYQNYQNLDVTIYPGFPTSFDSTQHIDMWMMPVGDDKVVIGDYASSGGQPYTISENAVADLTGRGYTVYRTPGWNSGGTHYTYTNAVVLNNLIFISSFGGAYASEDATALSVFQAAMPTHTVIQVDSSNIIHSAGAIHCVVMHVPAYVTTLRVTPGVGLAAAGPVGGPFAPDSIVYTLENTGDTPIDYSVTRDAAWLTITNGSGSIPAQSTVAATISINASANALGSGTHDATVTFANLTDSSGDTSRGISLVVGSPQPAYAFPMDADPGWSTTGEWSFGDPTGLGGGSYGNPDPDNGATGTNVCGVNLNGDYSTVVGGPYYLTTGAMDLSGVQDVTLKFQRWLNTDYVPYVSATIEVSNNGSDWTQVWANGASEIADVSWSEFTYDISAVADDQATVYLRWGHSVDQSGAYAYSGWNIDDVEIWGIVSAIQPGDIDSDGDRDIDDVYWFSQVLLDTGTYPPEYVGRCDMNGQNGANGDDIRPFVAALTGY